MSQKEPGLFRESVEETASGKGEGKEGGGGKKRYVINNKLSRRHLPYLTPVVRTPYLCGHTFFGITSLVDVPSSVLGVRGLKSFLRGKKDCRLKWDSLKDKNHGGWILLV